MKPGSSRPLGLRDQPATPTLGEIPPLSGGTVDPAVLAQMVRKIRMTWAVAMYLLAAECAWIVYRYIPAEYDDACPRWVWVAGAALIGTVMTLLGWMKHTFMESAVTWTSRSAGWIGVPVLIVVMVETSTDHSATKYYYRVNMRQLAAAIDQFRLEKLRAREFEAAITEFNRAIELEPTAEIFGGRGDANWELGDLDAAISDYRLAREAKVTNNVPAEYKKSLTEKLNRAIAERNKRRPARKK